MKGMTYAKAEDYEHQAEYLNQYFKQNFRKLSFHDAVDIIKPCGEDYSNYKLSGLDGKFWVWETLEEAIRGNIKEMQGEEALSLYKAFAYNYKGSEFLNAEFEEKMYLEWMPAEKLFTSIDLAKH